MYNAPVIAQIRSTSRELVRELGFMRSTLAGTDLPPSAVHAIIEIGVNDGLSAKDLCVRLLLEKSTVSRLVSSLIARKEVREIRSKTDARRKDLYLTAKGRRTHRNITKFAEQQVATAIAPLSNSARQSVLNGLRTYSTALKQGRLATDKLTQSQRVVIKTGYRSGLVGRIIGMHAAYYSKKVGFGPAFETKVAADLAHFINRLDCDRNAIWYAEADHSVVGSIAIDGEDLTGGRAHLRWFIVDGGLRGTGIGKALIETALQFCDTRGFSAVHLWTFEGLDTARRLYEKHGFSLAEEYYGNQWGSEVLEQRFVRGVRNQTSL